MEDGWSRSAPDGGKHPSSSSAAATASGRSPSNTFAACLKAACRNPLPRTGARSRRVRPRGATPTFRSADEGSALADTPAARRAFPAASKANLVSTPRCAAVGFPPARMPLSPGQNMPAGRARGGNLEGT